MMGSKQRHFAPLIQVSLEELVPADHFYRHLEQSLDLSFVREFVQETYASGGRPSIDPVVFFKLQLVMFFEDIRSERLLMRHAADRLSVRWYVGYDLDEPLPDHSSLTRIRTRYGIEVFRRFFEAIVEQCQQAGLVWGKELYIDATKVEANASMASVKPRFAVEAHLTNLFASSAEEAAAEPEQALGQENAAFSDAIEQKEKPVPVPLPTSLVQEEREELSHYNEQRHDWLEQLGAQDRRVSIPWYQRVADLRVSTTDPDASLMLTKGDSHLGYQTHYVVDGGKARIILGSWSLPPKFRKTSPCSTCSGERAFAGNCGRGKLPETANMAPKRTWSPSRASTSMPTFPSPTMTTALRSLALRSSSTTPSVMCTSVRQAKNSTTLPPIPRSGLAGIGHEPRTAITARSKPSLPPASRGAASAAVSMRTP